MKPRVTWHVFSFLLLLGFGGGLVLLWAVSTPQMPYSARSSEATGPASTFAFAPMIDASFAATSTVADDGVAGATTTTRPAPPDYDGLVSRLAALFDASRGTWGLYVYETDTGMEYGVNQDRLFFAASTAKVPLLLYVYRMIESGEVSRDDTLTYLESDWQEGTGSIVESGPGSRFSVMETLTRLIRESDNAAKNMLYRLAGRDNVREYIWSLGATSTDLGSAGLTTPHDMGLLLRLLHGEQVVGEDLTQEIMDLMTHSLCEECLPRNLEGVQVAHKIGWYEDQVSDIGIVLAEKPYIICLYCDGANDLEEAQATIAQVSLMVYEFESSRR